MVYCDSPLANLCHLKSIRAVSEEQFGLVSERTDAERETRSGLTQEAWTRFELSQFVAHAIQLWKRMAEEEAEQERKERARCHNSILERIFQLTSTRGRSESPISDHGTLKNIRATALGPALQLRYGLPVLIGGVVQHAIADRGAAANLISTDLAKALGIKVQLDSKCPDLGLPISKHVVKTIGRAKVVCQFPDEPNTRQSYEFFVCQNLDTPLIMGRNFLKETEIHTRHKHRLKNTVNSGHRLPCVLSITAENETQERLACSIDGHSLLARPDTGSVINAMSLTYAYLRNHTIDHTNQKRIRLGDGSIHVTIGTVWARVSLGDGLGPEELVEFDVIDALDVDIILGEQLLLDADAFVQYSDYLLDVPSDYLDFGSIVLLGKAERTIRYLREKSKSLVRIGKTERPPQIHPSEAEELEMGDNVEFHRRKGEEARIQGLTGEDREIAEDEERCRRSQFSRHRDGVKQLALKSSRRQTNPSTTSTTLSGNGSIGSMGALSLSAIQHSRSAA